MDKRMFLAGAGALSLAIATNFIGPWEGKRNDPYRDIVGIQTVCYGETRVKMRSYTDAECTEMLKEAVGDFQWEVVKCVPSLRDKPYQLAAATSLAYNIGSARFCNSTAAKKFRAGDYKGGCQAFYSWDKVTVNGKLIPVKGLANRRKEEVKLCLQGLM